jgi:uncharacterized protein YndB with AHSA1/START domain
MPDLTDLTKIERSVWIRAPRARVWRAIADIREFAAWFQVKAEGDFSPNARIRMTSTYPGHEGISFWVSVADVEPETRLSWRWHPGAVNPSAGEPMTVVEFLLTEENGGTRVTVIETGFDGISLARRAKAFEENTEGWELQLAALRKYASDAA